MSKVTSGLGKNILENTNNVRKVFTLETVIMAYYKLNKTLFGDR